MLNSRKFLITIYTLLFVTVFYAFLHLMLDAKYTQFFIIPGMNTYPNMALNILYQSGHFFQWSMGAALYFVPDLLTLFLIALVFKNPYTILITYGIVQLMLLSIIMPAIFKTATQSKLGFRLGILILLSFFLTIFIKQPVHSIFGHNAYLSASMAPGYHFGAALLVFFNLFLFLKNIQKPSIGLKLLLGFVLILSGLSDPLTYIYFSIPMIATLSIFYLLKYIPIKEYLYLLAILIVCALIAFVTYHSLPIQSQKINSSISLQLTYVVDFLKVLVSYISRNVIGGIGWVLFLFLAPFSLWKSLSQKDKSTFLIDYTILFFWATIIISTPLILLAIGQMVAPYYKHLPAAYIIHHPLKAYEQLQVFPIRYFINYLIGPSCFGMPLLIYKHYKKLEVFNQNRVYAAVLAIFMVAILIAMPHFNKENSFLSFQPKFMLCFDKYAKQYHLVNGVSEYQEDLTLVNAYNLNTHVAYVNNIIHPFDWQTTLQMEDYKNYNFVLAKTASLTAPLAKFIGKPDVILSCSGNKNKKSFILVYQHNQLNRHLDPKIFINSR